MGTLQRDIWSEILPLLELYLRDLVCHQLLWCCLPAAGMASSWSIRYSHKNTEPWRAKKGVEIWNLKMVLLKPYGWQNVKWDGSIRKQESCRELFEVCLKLSHWAKNMQKAREKARKVNFFLLNQPMICVVKVQKYSVWDQIISRFLKSFSAQCVVHVGFSEYSPQRIGRGSLALMMNWSWSQFPAVGAASSKSNKSNLSWQMGFSQSWLT